MSKSRIIKIIENRKIESLYHFTQGENLSSILKYGILSRESLNNKSIEACINDEERFDRCKNATCLSIGFPNYKMFYSLRIKDKNKSWIVLELSSDILIDFECAYCKKNAGDHEIFNMPIDDRKGRDAFNSLFEDDYIERNKLDIPDYYPSNPQAEVLVFSDIPMKYVKNIYVENEIDEKKYKIICQKNNVNLKLDKNYFYPRKDYGFWR